MPAQLQGLPEPGGGVPEPREIEPSSAAPKPVATKHEQVFSDDNRTRGYRQSAKSDVSGAFGRPKQHRQHSQTGREKRGPRTMLTDRQWKVARQFLYGERGKPGRNAVDNRGKLEGVLWIFRTGAPWRDLPHEFGRWENVYRTFRRWAERNVFLKMFLSLMKELQLKVVMVDGTFIKVHKHGTGALRRGLTPEDSRIAQAIGKTKGGLNTKLMALVDQHGRLAAFSLVPGQAFEAAQVKGLLAEVDTTSTETFLGDKAFDTNGVRRLLDDLGIEPTIPSKRNRKIPIPHDTKKYKGRHLNENLFDDLKEFRGLATRYCKYAATFCAGLHLVTWHRRTKRGSPRRSPYLDD